MRSVYTCKKKIFKKNVRSPGKLTHQINSTEKRTEKKLRNEKYNGKAQQFVTENCVIQIRSAFFWTDSNKMKCTTHNKQENYEMFAWTKLTLSFIVQRTKKT